MTPRGRLAVTVEVAGARAHQLSVAQTTIPRRAAKGRIAASCSSIRHAIACFAPQAGPILGRATHQQISRPLRET
jgi:hypothetical protein